MMITKMLIAQRNQKEIALAQMVEHCARVAVACDGKTRAWLEFAQSRRLQKKILNVARLLRQHIVRQICKESIERFRAARDQIGDVSFGLANLLPH